MTVQNDSANRSPDVAVADATMRSLERDLAAVAETWSALLPAVLPQCAGYEVVASNRPAGQTSGDVCDVARTCADTLFLLVADAAGHGLGPAISAMQLRAMARIAVRLGASLERLVSEAGQQLAADLPPDRFVTAFVGELDPATDTLRYLAPGQGPLLHWHAATRIAEWRTASSPPLGVACGPYDAPPPLRLEPGDVVVVATDGIFERQDASGRLFGEAGVEAVLREVGGASAESIRRALQSRADEFAGGLPAGDDASVLIVKRMARS